MAERPEIDRWLMSLLNTLIKNVKECYEGYDITGAGRLIQDFVCDNLSNWYVRLNRKRFWGGQMNDDSWQPTRPCTRPSRQWPCSRLPSRLSIWTAFSAT